MDYITVFVKQYDLKTEAHVWEKISYIGIGH